MTRTRREQFEEMLKILNGTAQIDNVVSWVYSTHRNLVDEYFPNEELLLVASGVDLNFSQWKELETLVFTVGEFLFGVRGVSIVYSGAPTTESSVRLRFFEVQKVLTTSYEEVTKTSTK
jgi:hypothetical protein